MRKPHFLKGENKQEKRGRLTWGPALWTEGRVYPLSHQERLVTAERKTQKTCRLHFYADDFHNFKKIYLYI